MFIDDEAENEDDDDDDDDDNDDEEDDNDDGFFVDSLSQPPSAPYRPLMPSQGDEGLDRMMRRRAGVADALPDTPPYQARGGRRSSAGTTTATTPGSLRDFVVDDDDVVFCVCQSTSEGDSHASGTTNNHTHALFTSPCFRIQLDLVGSTAEFNDAQRFVALLAVKITRLGTRIERIVVAIHQACRGVGFLNPIHVGRGRGKQPFVVDNVDLCLHITRLQDDASLLTPTVLEWQLNVAPGVGFPFCVGLTRKDTKDIPSRNTLCSKQAQECVGLFITITLASSETCRPT